MTLSPSDRASFATSSRLLSCLVTESLLTAIFVPIPSHSLQGIALVLTSSATKRDALPPYSSDDDIFAVIPLCHTPIFKSNSDTQIALLDPLDMHPALYEILQGTPPVQNGHSQPPCSSVSEHLLLSTLSHLLRDSSTPISLTPTPGPLHLWKKFADAFNIDHHMQDAVADELRSSVAWQQYSYEHPPPQPTFDSPSIAWEQSIIEGHPTHPMHKARKAIPPIPHIQPGDYDWQHPLIRLVAVPRTSLRIQGPWDDLLAPLRTLAAQRAGRPLDVPHHDQTIVPIHALQVPNILQKFPDARVLPEEYHLDALAQQSLRSVLVPSALPSLSLKLAMGIRLTSAIRTISPSSAFLGPRFSSIVVPRLTYDRSLLIVQRELASIVHVNPDPETAKHLAGIVREAYENTCLENHGERAIVCTALVETAYDDGGVPLVQSTFGLDTEEKRIAWLDTFVNLFFKAFLPSVIANGVAFEAHPQNTLARFDAHTRELKGFVIRDFGGLRIHPPTLIASTDLKTLDSIIAPGHSIIADTVEDVHTRLYHTLIHNHLQQLIRVLGLHYSGAGWRVVRRRLEEQIPEGHELRRLWLGVQTETLPGKCFMRMRLQGMYRTHLHGPFSNLIHYKGTGDRK